MSSSGSGVAAAAGLAYATLGSDTGGSIRFPSAACGLVGVKPTYGRVSRHGVFPLAESLDHIGPMTRTVADAALMLGVMAGYDDADSTSLSEPVPDYVSSCLSENSLDGVKIGIDWEYCTAGVDDEVVEELRRVADQFVALGAQLVEVTLPASYRDLVSGWGITCGVECARAHAAYYPARAYEYGPVLSQLIELGRAVPPDRYALLEHVREVFRSGFDALLEQVDVFLSPCMTCLPLPVEVMENTAAAEDSRADFITFTAPFDYSGHPTLTLPAGVRGGKPVSFQLVGPWLGEAQLFSIGTAYENLQGVQPHPPL